MGLVTGFGQIQYRGGFGEQMRSHDLKRTATRAKSVQSYRLRDMGISMSTSVFNVRTARVISRRSTR